MTLRVLFVTRKYPPSVGGMETLAAGVWRTLAAAQPDALLIQHGGSNSQLPRWLPGALVRTAVLLARRRAGVVLCGDALMYALLYPVLRLFRLRHATMVMGKDLTFDNRFYRAVVHPLVRRAPLVIAISEATAASARAIGVPADRVRVVRLGVRAPEVTAADRAAARAGIVARHGLPADSVLLVTLGRLVRRKGVLWLVEHVVPKLPDEVVYLVAGDGEDRAPLRAAVELLGLERRVLLLGQVGDAEREALLRGADLFVQPNIAVPGDMEGFGLVVVEAAMRGEPVVAAALEGILDAVADGSTGLLLPSGDTDAWVAGLTELTADPAGLAELGARFQAASRERYAETEMGRQLVGLLGSAGPAQPAAG
jgi:phosphatidylinositol alpha-1,6-mannosyltransferase